MLRNIAEEISLHLITHKIIKIENREFYIYGIELFLSSLIIALAISAIAVLTNTILISLIYSIVFCTLRAYSGGYHCKTYLGCFITSLGIYVSMLLINANIVEHKFLLSAILVIISLPVIIIYAPVEHKNNPLDFKDKIKYRKMSLVFLLLFLLIYILSLIFKASTISFVISWAITASAVLILITRIGGSKNENGGIESSSKIG